MNFLITGAAGMLGKDVGRPAAAAGHDVSALARSELDVTDPVAIRAALDAADPDVALTCAASTDVDGAETQFEAALAVIAKGWQRGARGGRTGRQDR